MGPGLGQAELLQGWLLWAEGVRAQLLSEDEEAGDVASAQGLLAEHRDRLGERSGQRRTGHALDATACGRGHQTGRGRSSVTRDWPGLVSSTELEAVFQGGKM